MSATTAGAAASHDAGTAQPSGSDSRCDSHVSRWFLHHHEGWAKRRQGHTLGALLHHGMHAGAPMPNLGNTSPAAGPVFTPASFVFAASGYPFRRTKDS
ncbi:hypothetical protein A5630_03605 [Mycolicibacterium mucogenicum]|uniref:Uncharacterized protein n=1 Tax=Mycolicibacterium mucogenicum TaxID=56689 RepID=A0A1A3GPE5_MYCMU|nr:hypothetical protein A5630_03605 [Mycolicibacterium mucogenicum]